MTWLDITLILVLLCFVALGARLGSVWTGACVIGGFFGAYLVEYYTLPVSEMMGGFSGARLLSGALLFIGGVVIALVPGWALSRLMSAFFLGIFDSIVGLAAGALAGLVAVTLFFMLVLPHVPSIEKSKAWRKSRVVKPMHHMIEDFFNDRRFRKGSTVDQLKDDFTRDIEPAIENTGEKVKDTVQSVTKTVKKKVKQHTK